MGHEESVAKLPTDAILLAFSKRASHQAYKIKDKPIYCTQFHPELNVVDMEGRIKFYPEYIARIRKHYPEAISDGLKDTPQAEALLLKFVKLVLD